MFDAGKNRFVCKIRLIFVPSIRSMKQFKQNGATPDFAYDFTHPSPQKKNQRPFRNSMNFTVQIMHIQTIHSRYCTCLCGQRVFISILAKLQLNRPDR